MLLYLRHVANYWGLMYIHVIIVNNYITWFLVLYGLMAITKVVVMDMSGPASGG